MERSFTLDDGNKYTFRDCTVIFSDFREEGRLPAVYLAIVSPDSPEISEGVIGNGARVPENEEDALEVLMNEDIDEDCETIETVEFEGGLKPSDFCW